MKCPNCSKEIRDGATFCGFCGKPVAQPSKAASAASPARSARRGAPSRPSAPRQPVQRAPVQAAPKKKRTGLIVAACVLAFLLIAGGVFGFLVTQGVIDFDLDLGSVFSFLQSKDNEDGGDRRSRDRDEDDEDDRRGRDRDEDDEDEDDRRGRDRDEDGEDEDDRRGRDRDKEDEGDRRESVAAGTVAGEAPAEEPARSSISSWYSDIAVCVEDPDQLWPDTRTKPFEGAAERLYWHTDRSLLVITADNTGGDIAAFTYDCVQEFRASNPNLGARLDEIVAITFDRVRLSCYMARYTDTAHAYDLDELVRTVGSYISGGDYETAAVYLLKNAAEPENSEYLLPTSNTAYLTRDDLLGLTWEECCFARNEIYARHGRIFSTPAIRAYFESKSWYSGTINGSTFDANVSNYLSALERANVNLIAEYERTTWGGSFY